MQLHSNISCSWYYDKLAIVYNHSSSAWYIGCTFHCPGHPGTRWQAYRLPWLLLFFLLHFCHTCFPHAKIMRRHSPCMSACTVDIFIAFVYNQTFPAKTSVVFGFFEPKFVVLPDRRFLGEKGWKSAQKYVCVLVCVFGGWKWSEENGKVNPRQIVKSVAALQLMQSLARIMAAYFANGELYVYHPHRSRCIPTLHCQQPLSTGMLDRPTGYRIFIIGWPAVWFFVYPLFSRLK